MTDTTPRRSLFGRMAGVMATGLAGLLPAPAMAAEPAEWPGVLPGRHRLMVDGYAVNGGAPLRFANTFLATNPPAGSSNVVLILRAEATPLGLNNAMWAKYRIGETFKIIDPETNAPAVKNPHLSASLDRLHEAGGLIGVCNVALRGQSKTAAANAGVSADEAAREWAANLVPGATLIPSGVWGVARAQEAGCAYCSGGG